MSSVRRFGLFAQGLIGRPLRPAAIRVSLCQPDWFRRSSSREGYPGGLEDVLAALAADRVQASVLEPDQAVEGAGRDDVGHLELPPQRPRRRVLVALGRAG